MAAPTKTVLTAALLSNVSNTASAVLTLTSQASFSFGQETAKNILQGGVFIDDNGVCFSSKAILSITVTLT